VWTAGSSQNIFPNEEGKATGSGASGCGGVGEANFLPQWRKETQFLTNTFYNQ